MGFGPVIQIPSGSDPGAGRFQLIPETGDNDEVANFRRMPYPVQPGRAVPMGANRM